MLTKNLTISNTLGLHVRASNKLVECASKFISEIYIELGQERIDAKRILQVMTLGAKLNDIITISVIGSDAELALEKLTELIDSGFGENQTCE